jgi:VanZ family protein
LKKIPAILPALMWFVITTILLCLPGSAFPKENWFDRIWLDKWIHVGLFSVMVWLWCRVAANSRGQKMVSFFQMGIYFFLYGVVMEFVQKFFIPNRSFDIADIAADGAGCVLGVLLSMRLYIKK